ncbi:MAG: family 16 glycosylhydrolase [Phenylobacterium sp.]|uniref:family 16 glycosylhydrolase n=1 Tax=Phenylobacterium sp. TaxID=1871053 RepID=UPI00273158DB|nr:family 16 glycosylhydrolase [Phenylobacterium sp.]MDP2009288.1 family 16 glycosylhydrolase [Phenylobacterium sp.]
MALYKYDGALAVETGPSVSNFYGAGGIDTLTGTSLAEGFWGGQGDLMIGGGGDDTYYLKTSTDRIVEQAGGGTDKIVAWQNVYLGNYANVENVEISGDNLYAAGNAVDNIVRGGSGKEQIYGGGGQDILIGGAGADVFIVYKGEGNDVIQDFSVAEDVIRLKAGFSAFGQLQPRLSQVGTDVKLDLGDGDGLILRDVTLDKLTAANFQLQLDPSQLGSLSFADEFSGQLSIWDKESNPSGLWRPDFGYQGTQGVGSYSLVNNSELQIYTSPYFRDHNGDFSDTPFVNNPDGSLSIWAKPSVNSEIFGYGYTSGLITTQPTFAQTYGYFEMRADVPQAAGAWPAFWLLPKDGSWPPELDVMEVLSQDPNATWTTAHSGVGGHTSSGIASFTPDTPDGMHTYGVLWTPSSLSWYVDGVQVFQAATPSDMNKPMFMLANMAVGGWAGTVDNGALPAELKIDYIRAYALPGVTVSSVVAPAGQTAPPPVADPLAPAYSNSLFALPDSGAYTRMFLGSAKPDTLTGLPGNDFIDGRGNADKMRGAGGDDTYVVDRLGDIVIENAGGGVDQVLSTSPSYTLSANVENLKLVGASPQAAVGNELNNRLTSNDAGSTLSGGAGNDILLAGRGADVLTGGEGRDIFQFQRLPTNGGHITDFVRGQDMIDLRDLFASVGYGGSDPVADQYIQFRSDGADGVSIYFDADGVGAGAAVLVTTIDHVSPAALSPQNDWFFH